MHVAKCLARDLRLFLKIAGVCLMCCRVVCGARRLITSWAWSLAAQRGEERSTEMVVALECVSVLTLMRLRPSACSRAPNHCVRQSAFCYSSPASNSICELKACAALQRCATVASTTSFRSLALQYVLLYILYMCVCVCACSSIIVCARSQLHLHLVISLSARVACELLAVAPLMLMRLGLRLRLCLWQWRLLQLLILTHLQSSVASAVLCAADVGVLHSLPPSSLLLFLLLLLHLLVPLVVTVSSVAAAVVVARKCCKQQVKIVKSMQQMLQQKLPLYMLLELCCMAAGCSPAKRKEKRFE